MCREERGRVFVCVVCVCRTLKDYWLSAGDWIPEDQQGKAKAGSEQHSKA